MYVCTYKIYMVFKKEREREKYTKWVAVHNVTLQKTIMAPCKKPSEKELVLQPVFFKWGVTVDGRNPSPPGMYKALQIMG